ncbi:MAG: bifunctional glutamate N-acetyltransferase/amino-acid acetyltransferase ArgJ [Gammaproteobacteria bacterium]|jgi:glutamate N-acetyltransferase / amino-acid N-acetyltransferase|nr:bifunctional glutamate N-acetyltransferase/amino-acid acetyltransferase ArgJ [Gammaproteobacteria bacterium]
MNTEQEKLHPINGIRLSAVSAGIKTAGKLDLVLLELCEGASVAGVYTQNAFCAAPVALTKKHSESHSPRYFLINSGNANAGTGEQGVQSAIDCCAALAMESGCDTKQVLPFSTGVIGEELPVDKIKAALSKAVSQFNSDSWHDAALGIMTTDTVPKAYSEIFELAGKQFTITGIAKGAGMIKPNMATLLAYIGTDAEIPEDALQKLCQDAANLSFNRITVDGDTSTNDSCMLVASGQGELKYSQITDKEKSEFAQALNQVFEHLAQAIIKDAEGASKFVSIEIEEGENAAECLQLAYAIAESSLVKTALFASDPNWGRILAVVGRSGLNDLDIAKVSIYLDDVCIVAGGGKCPSYTEAMGQAVMNQSEIKITVKLNRGSFSEQVWTCDLSYDYVKINAEYRT